jgi:hypothetical protein
MNCDTRINLAILNSRGDSMSKRQTRESARRDETGSPACECIWLCGRGPTRLRCEMRREGDDHFQVEVLRNSRVYGSYRFTAKALALSFAARLRDTFQGNGWVPAS